MQKPPEGGWDHLILLVNFWLREQATAASYLTLSAPYEYSFRISDEKEPDQCVGAAASPEPRGTP